MTSMPVAGTPSLPGPAEATPSTPNALNPLNILDALRKQKIEKELVSWVDTEFQTMKTARTVYEQQWYLNLAFYSGRQYVNPIDVPNVGFRLKTPASPPWRVRIVVNKIRTAVRTEYSKLTSSRAVPTVIPATNEDEDFMAARVGEQILKSHFHDAKFRKEFKRWVWWGAVCGNSFYKQYWDGSKIDPTVQPPPQPYMGMDGKPLMGPDGQPQMMQQPPVKGVVCGEAVTPFHIYVPDLLSEDINDQPYIMHVMTRTPLWVKTAYGIDAAPDSMSTNTILESAVLSPKGVQSQDSVLVKEVWIKPNGHKDFPEGGLLTVVGGKLVQHLTKWPYPFEEYPFHKYEGIPTGAFYSDSIVVDLIPLQKEYNRTKSQMIEIKNTMQKPKILYQQGSINPRKINSEPGQGIPYLAGFAPPQVMPVPEVPATMGIELDRLTSDFDDISGQHEITRGNTPAQVTSGTAIAFLQEQDDSKLSHQVGTIEYCMETVGRHYLKFISNYWTEERLVRVTGVENYLEARRWKGSDLRGNTDVRVQSGSALPQSKAARQALLTEFMQYGWIDPASGLEVLELNGLEKVVEDFLVDKRQAQRENMKLMDIDPGILKELQAPPVGPDGQPVLGPDGNPIDPVTGKPHQPQPSMPVNSWDNHAVHIQVHNQFRKSQQFEILDPAIKQEFELHVQLHQLAMSMPQIGAGGNVIAQPEAPPVGPGGEGPPPEQGAPNNFTGEGGEQSG